MTVKNSDVLTAARRLISDPKNWTTGELARDKEGLLVLPDSPFACSWCALGARDRALKIFGKISNDYIWDALDIAAVKINPLTDPEKTDFDLRPIAALNDKLGGHAAVLRAYDLAIETEKAREEAEARELTEALEQTGKADA